MLKPVMAQDNPSCRLEKTTTGKPQIVIGGECDAGEFPRRAMDVVVRLGMVVEEQISGLDALVWIARLGEHQFCISWDIWFPEVAVMAWRDTPDTAVEALMAMWNARS